MKPDWDWAAVIAWAVASIAIFYLFMSLLFLPLWSVMGGPWRWF